MENNNKKAVSKSFDEMFGDAQEFIPDTKDIDESEFEVLDEVDAGGEEDLGEIDITGLKTALGKSGAINGVFPEKGVEILITGVQDGDCWDAASYLREKFANEDLDVRIYYLGTYIDHDDDDTAYESMLFCNLPDEVSEFDNFFKSYFWEQLINELGNENSSAYNGYVNTPQDPEDLQLTEAELDDYYEALESQQVDKKN
jgi:hypothetical protein